MRIYINIREMMERCGMTNFELAEALEVSDTTVALWKSGERTPSLPHIGQMLEVFGCELDELLIAE